MKNVFIIIVGMVLLGSCKDKVVAKPENLIPKEKMMAILYDLAILNSAKNTDPKLLEENNIETMAYLYNKYHIDSLQLVNSDRYYASIPLAYEAIYTNVETRLTNEKDRLETEKRKKDSLQELKRKDKIPTLKKTIKDSVGSPSKIRR